MTLSAYSSTRTRSRRPSLLRSPLTLSSTFQPGNMSSGINITGLAFCIAACLLIVRFVQQQLSYDRYNNKADRIVRVVLKGKMQVGEIKESHFMPPVAATLKKDFPEIEEATRIRAYGAPRI